MEPADVHCICCRCGKTFSGQAVDDGYTVLMTWPLWCLRCLGDLKARAEMFRRCSLAAN
jgi:hypothetical protein